LAVIVTIKTQVVDLDTLEIILAFAARNLEDTAFIAEQAAAHGMTFAEAYAFQVRCINVLKQALVSRGSKQLAIAPAVASDPQYDGAQPPIADYPVAALV
jgi:hypothetical protein